MRMGLHYGNGTTYGIRTTIHLIPSCGECPSSLCILSVTMATGSLKLCVDDNPMWTLKVTHNFFSAGKLHFKVSTPVFVLVVLQCMVY